jgi:hypothetical protein
MWKLNLKDKCAHIYICKYIYGEREEEREEEKEGERQREKKRMREKM